MAPSDRTVQLLRAGGSCACSQLMRRQPVVKQLGDEFGDYLLTIECRQCKHNRVAEPRSWRSSSDGRSLSRRSRSAYAVQAATRRIANSLRTRDHGPAEKTSVNSFMSLLRQRPTSMVVDSSTKIGCGALVAEQHYRCLSR